jgi:hypothetical protein
MIIPTPTADRGIFTAHTDNREELAKLLPRLGDVTLAIASPSLARMAESHTGPPPPLPGGEFTDRLTAEAEAAGVPPTAVLTVVMALLEATTPAGTLPAYLDAIKLPPTLIVGKPAQCVAVLTAAEAVVAAAPYRSGA